MTTAAVTTDHEITFEWEDRMTGNWKQSVHSAIREGSREEGTSLSTQTWLMVIIVLVQSTQLVA